MLADKIRKTTRGVVLAITSWAYLMTLAGLGMIVYLLFVFAFFFPNLLLFRLLPFVLSSIFIFLPALIALFVVYFERHDIRHLTLTLEQHYPKLGNRLLTMIELTENSAPSAANPFSQILVKGLEREMNELVDRFGFRRAVSWKKPLIPFALLFLLVLTGVAHATVQPSFFILGFQRLTQGAEMNLSSGAAPGDGLPRFQIEVIPGDCDVAKGSNLLIKARILNDVPKQVELRVNQNQEPGWRILPMARVEGQEYQYILTHVVEPSSYFVQADRQRSPTYKIKIFEPLGIERALWRMEFPAYMNLP